MDAAPARFPMPVGEFVKGEFLRRADVVLMRGHRLFSRAIRYATDSPFSHAALVFLVPDLEQGFDHAFLLEAVPAGVDVSRVSHVTEAKADGSYPAAVAILRLKAPWFSDDVARVVRGHMLNFIQAGYDWRTVFSIVAHVLRARLLGRKEEVPHAFARALIKAQARKGRAPGNFICSGFVQYGYLRALQDLADQAPQPITEAPITEAEVQAAVFNARLAEIPIPAMLGEDPASLAILMSTTPEEISRSANLEWKYVLLRGQAYEVADREAAVRLIAQAP
jgi:hypothetical protein